MQRPPIRAFVATLALALFSAAVPFAVHARTNRLPEDLETIQRLEARRHLAPPSAASLAAAGAQDTTGPQLLGLKTAATLDVNTPGQDARLWYTVTDDLAGFTFGIGWASGPYNKPVYLWLGNQVPTTAATNAPGRMTTSAWTPPGTYRITEVQLYDAAGNWRTYPYDQLVALGIATEFTVANPKGGDAVAPTLVHGTVKTTSLSLSALQPGTTEHAVFSVDVHMNDTGNPQVSGIRTANVVFCLLDQSACIHAPNNQSFASGVADGTVTAWQIPADQGLVPGTYHLREVDLYDAADNRRVYIGTKFGGTTDFSTLFNTTKVTLAP